MGWHHHNFPEICTTNFWCNGELSGCNIWSTELCRTYILTSLCLEPVVWRESGRGTMVIKTKTFFRDHSPPKRLISPMRRLGGVQLKDGCDIEDTTFTLSRCLRSPNPQCKRQWNLLLKCFPSFSYIHGPYQPSKGVDRVSFRNTIVCTDRRKTF